MVHYSVIMLTTKDARTGAPIEVEKGIWFNAVHRQQDGIYILRYVHVKNIVTEYHCLTFYQLLYLNYKVFSKCLGLLQSMSVQTLLEKMEKECSGTFL